MTHQDPRHSQCSAQVCEALRRLYHAVAGALTFKFNSKVPSTVYRRVIREFYIVRLLKGRESLVHQIRSSPKTGWGLRYLNRIMGRLLETLNSNSDLAWNSSLGDIWDITRQQDTIRDSKQAATISTASSTLTSRKLQYNSSCGKRESSGSSLPHSQQPKGRRSTDGRRLMCYDLPLFRPRDRIRIVRYFIKNYVVFETGRTFDNVRIKRVGSS